MNLDGLGARVVGPELPIHDPVIDVVQQARARARFRLEIEGCHRCPLGAPDGQVAFTGPARPRFAVIGEAPGDVEVKLGRPFVGPSGKLLRALFTQAGLDPADVYYCNTVSCHPVQEGRTRNPTMRERAACREHLIRQLSVAGTRHVLLVGASALDAWRSDMRVTKDHGRVGVMLDQWVVMPTFHPAAALGGRQPGLKAVIAQDLARWAEVLAVPHDRTWIRSECARCFGQADEWDRDGVGYCARHWGRFKDQWQRDRNRWTHGQEQLVMF